MPRNLTAAQLQTLKAAILADATLSVLPNTPDDNYTIAAAFNAASSPAFIVWKTSVSITAVGDAINATELVGLTSLNLQRLQAIAAFAPGTINPSLQDRRDAFDQVFSSSGGTITRPALAILWKRTAARAEKLYATGTGTTAAPATLVVEGAIDYVDVTQARNS